LIYALKKIFMKSIIIEAGINYFGNLREANRILNYFLKVWLLTNGLSTRWSTSA